MKLKQFLALGTGLFFAGITVIHAQTVFTYGNHSVDEKDFIENYKKNNSGSNGKATTLKDYLNLYALYRMKVQEALDTKMDTTTTVKNELAGYKAQLTHSELLDKAVTNRLVDEAYNRMKQYRKVSHILISVANSADSLQAKAKIDSIYQVLKSGKVDFATMAERFSQDQTTAKNGGSLGWMTALQTPYPFETAVYNTDEGKISAPFRTVYGYDIVKVEKVIPNPGQVEVAQILVAAPDYYTPAQKAKALATANEVEGEIKKGRDFSTLVAQYSEDKFSVDNQGVLKPFSLGELLPAFEDAAFKLKNPGDVSEPVETPYGYHILKLIKKIPFQPLDSMRDDLTTKVKSDSREIAAQKVYFNSVKSQLQFREYEQNLEEMLHTIDTDKTMKDFGPARYPQLKNPLFSLDGNIYTQQDFLGFARKYITNKILGNRRKLVQDLYNSYVNQVISNVQEEKLISSRPDLQKMVDEYKNGILLFDLMDQKVWTKATTDLDGLQKYYDDNKSKYQWEPGFEGTIFTSASEDNIKALKPLLSSESDPQAALKKALAETGDETQVVTQDGRFAFKKIPFPASTLKAHQGTDIFQSNDPKNPYGIAFIKTIYNQPGQKSFEDARGFVVADYQDYLEKQWDTQLMKKYPLKINDQELQKLEKEYK